MVQVQSHTTVFVMRMMFVLSNIHYGGCNSGFNEKYLVRIDTDANYSFMIVQKYI